MDKRFESAEKFSKIFTKFSDYNRWKGSFDVNKIMDQIIEGWNTGFSPEEITEKVFKGNNILTNIIEKPFYVWGFEKLNDGVMEVVGIAAWFMLEAEFMSGIGKIFGSENLDVGGKIVSDLFYKGVLGLFSLPMSGQAGYSYFNPMKVPELWYVKDILADALSSIGKDILKDGPIKGIFSPGSS